MRKAIVVWFLIFLVYDIEQRHLEGVFVCIRRRFGVILDRCLAYKDRICNMSK